MLGFSQEVRKSGSRQPEVAFGTPWLLLSRREFLRVAGLTAVGVTVRRCLGPLARGAAAEDGTAWAFDGAGLVFPAYFVTGPPIIDPTAMPAPTPQRTYLPTILKGDE